MTFTIHYDRLKQRIDERLEEARRLRLRGVLIFRTKAQRKAAASMPMVITPAPPRAPDDAL